MDISKIKIIMFDTFGTIMDWLGAIVETGICLGSFSIDWNMESSMIATDEIAKGLKPLETNDVITKRKLLELIERYKISFIRTKDIEQRSPQEILMVAAHPTTWTVLLMLAFQQSIFFVHLNSECIAATLNPREYIT
ncbi:hypothetical protein ACFPES_04020 [Paenibacillus sp. GCM10023248]|uniref:hypothetical protein n=1 Tax=unclassified Paenibacillus TaxID=185978 RepID=UPI002378F2AB|nr:hypothetical protein [Paenibacillus sp. MAHUQ-63]MDD9266195.1 hypothetical protein [Paenibacillus sp. MAHUQ-63]